MAEEESERPELEEWPLQGYLDQLEALDLGQVEGRPRLGNLAFDRAPQQIREIIEILHDLRLESWERLDPPFVRDLQGQLIQLTEVLEEMRNLTAAADGAAGLRNKYESRLDEIHSWFQTYVAPRCIRARVREEIEAQSPTRADEEIRHRLAESLRQIEGLERRRNELAHQLEELAPVVEAQREAASGSAAGELSTEYTAQANRHAEDWKQWLKWLVAAIVVAIVGGVAVVITTHPDADATNAEIVSALAIDLLVIGILLYLIRITSLQFRVHRHLEAVAHSKAAALSTFNRIVAGPAEADVRTAVAQVLAQAVFKTDDTGFIDAGAEHITLIERVVGPAVQRVSQ